MENSEYEEIKNEARKCIEIHSHLFTCLYNWASTHTFYKQKVICWSTTAAYYAMMHAVRTLFSLIQLRPEFSETRKKRLIHVMKYHDQFHLFLRSKTRTKQGMEDLKPQSRDIKIRDICIACFNKLFSGIDWDRGLKDIGEELALHKRARESESYEHFVVAHHARGYHYEYPFIQTIFEKSEEDANKFIPKVLQYFLKFYSKDFPFKGHHLWHLKDEIKWLDATMRTEKLKASDEMLEFLNSVRELVKDASKPVDFDRFEEEMDMKLYRAKAKVYKDLEDIAEALKR